MITIGRHRYLPFKPTPEQIAGLRWDTYEPSPTTAYAEPRSQYVAGPGAKYRRIADVGLAGGADYPLYTYWELAE